VDECVVYHVVLLVVVLWSTQSEGPSCVSTIFCLMDRLNP